MKSFYFVGKIVPHYYFSKFKYAIEIQTHIEQIKTVIQMTGISLVISTPLIEGMFYFEIAISILILGTLMSYYSAYEYFKKSFSYIK